MIGLTPDAAQRVAEVTRLIERRPKFPAPPDIPRVVASANKYAVTMTAISAGTVVDGVRYLGTGVAELHTVDRTGDKPELKPTGIRVPVENGGPAIGAGRLIQVKPVDDCMTVDVDYCP